MSTLKPPMRKAFEIVYADGSIVAGTTKRQFSKAPEDGIQFVIVRDRTGALRVLKGQSEYEYAGAVKPGAWTERENYDALKSRLLAVSKLLVSQDRDPRDIRLSALRARRRFR